MGPISRCIWVAGTRYWVPEYLNVDVWHIESMTGEPWTASMVLGLVALMDRGRGLDEAARSAISFGRRVRRTVRHQ